MIQIKGKYNTAIVFTDNVESSCLDQVKTLLNCKVFEDAKIRIMPDCHAGKGCVIGYTQTITDKIVANLVGMDINCGMAYVKIPEIDLRTLDKIIHQHIPSGMDIHKPGVLASKLTRKTENLISCLHTKLASKKIPKILNSVGTLGGGNHFIEVAKSKETGQWYLIIHSGSRNLGIQVCTYWQNIAINNLTASEEQSEKDKKIPMDLAYLTGEDMKGYLHDVEIASKYANLNRETIAEIILGKLGVLSKKTEIKTTCHNYIDISNGIIRKGAISANAGEEVLIPLNMRDGSLLCVGKGNPDWNYSAPHGAGRIMSRSQAKQSVSMEEFRKSIEGIYTTSISESTLDESPMAYKSSSEIESLIGDTVEVREHLIPLYNFKASEKSS